MAVLSKTKVSTSGCPWSAILKTQKRGGYYLNENELEEDIGDAWEIISFPRFGLL